MSLQSLLIGLYRVALILFPFIAIYYTADDQNAFFAISLLFVFEFSRGWGYSAIEHIYGLESYFYISVIIVCKALPNVYLDYNAVGFWSGVVFLEVVYIVLRFTSYRIYIDQWRYSIQQQEKLRGEQERSGWLFSKTYAEQGKEGLEHISFRNLCLLVGTVALFNIGRLLNLYFNYYSTSPVIGYSYEQCIPCVCDSFDPDCSCTDDTYCQTIYAPASTENWYSSNNLIVYTSAVETLVVIVMIVRLSYHGYSEDQRDVVKDYSGLIFVYLYLNLVMLLSLDAYSAYITIGMIVFTMGALVLVEKQMAKRGGTWANSFVASIIGWVLGLWEVFKSEPILQLLYIILLALTMYGSTQKWYISKIFFANTVRTFTCAPYKVLVGPVKSFYVFTSNEAVADGLAIVTTELSRYRIKLADLIAYTLPHLQTGCFGFFTNVVPWDDLILVAFMALTWFTGLLLILQVFPEARRLVQTSKYWAFCLIVCFMSIIATQAFGDVQGWVFWSILSSTYSRTYSNIGYGMIFTQVGLCIVACMLFFDKTNDESIREQIANGTKVSGKATDAIKPYLDVLLRPGVLLIIVSVSIFIALTIQGGPIDSIQLDYIGDDNRPDWLVIPKEDRFVSNLETSLATLFSRTAVRVFYIVKLATWLFTEAFGGQCWAGVCIDQIINALFTNGIEKIFNWLLDGTQYLILLIYDATKNELNSLLFGLPKIIDDVLSSLPLLDTVVDFNIFQAPTIPDINWPDIPFSSLRYPAYLPWFITIGGVIFILVALFAIKYGGVIQVASRILASFVFSLMIGVVGGAIRVIDTFHDYGYSFSIKWNYRQYYYLAAATILVGGIAIDYLGGPSEEEDRKEAEERTKTKGSYTLIKQTHKK